MNTTTQLVDRALELMDDYLRDGGCPCHFPRFRAVVGRDTAKTCGVPYRSEDQSALIYAYEQRATLSEKKALGPYREPLPGMWEAKCLRCGSGVERSSNEGASGGWVDMLFIRRPPGFEDVGAPVERSRVWRCRPFVAVGPSVPGGMKIAAKLFPFVSEDEWFAWLRAKREP